MKRDSEYKDYIVEDVLGHIAGISVRGMFGGWGIYLNKVIVGIIAEGELYLKADPEIVLKYKKAGCYPFSYDRNGKIIEMAYMSVPLETLENQDLIKERIDESYDISLKSKKKQ